MTSKTNLALEQELIRYRYLYKLATNKFVKELIEKKVKRLKEVKKDE